MCEDAAWALHMILTRGQIGQTTMSAAAGAPISTWSRPARLLDGLQPPRRGRRRR